MSEKCKNGTRAYIAELEQRLVSSQRLITAIGSVIAAQDSHDVPAEAAAMEEVRGIYAGVVGK
ncbi:MAG: hypothetical protein AAGU23_06625 [Bacillota bacterium]